MQSEMQINLWDLEDLRVLREDSVTLGENDCALYSLMLICVGIHYHMDPSVSEEKYMLAFILPIC